jgi:hypothetical protein
MPTSRPFAFNSGSTISGTIQIGDLAIGYPITGFTNNPQFWNGPDEDLGYVIAYPQPNGLHPNPVFIPAFLGFKRSKFLTEQSFIDIANYVADGATSPFTSGNEASTWLTNNGYWNSWVLISPTPTPTPTVTPTPINVQTCSLIFNSDNAGIYAYDSSTNTTTFLYNSGFVSSDIANTQTKLWIYMSSIYEYDITLSPWSITFNRAIDLSVGLGNGLAAINNTTLISTDGGSDIITLDITTSAATSTVIGSLPPGRIVSGDILQTTTTPPKIIVTNQGGDGYFLSQYVVVGGLAVFETEVDITPYSTSAYGLYEDNSLLYFVDGNSGQIFNVNLNPPYNITGTTGYTGYVVYGASQVPSCLDVSLILATPTPTVTPTNTITPTLTVTPTNTITPTLTVTPTNTITPTVTVTPTQSITPTPTSTTTPTITPTTTVTPTNTITPTLTITPTKTITPTPTITPTITPTPVPVVIPSSGLTLYVDAGRSTSYSGSGVQWYDLSGNNNTGTLQNSPSYSSSNGGILTFNGSNQYVSFSSPTNIPIGNSNYTISVWFNTSGLGTNAFVGWGGFGSTNQVTALRLSSTGFIHYWWGNDLVVNTSLSTNTWYNVVARFNGTNREIWLNNVKIGNDTPSGHNVPNANNLRIASSNGGEYFNGKLSNIEIYNRSLSDSEIGQIYNNYLYRF